MSECATDASVLARRALRVRTERRELAVESLCVLAVLERERGSLLGDGTGSDQACEGDGKDDNAGETHGVVNGKGSGRKDRARIARATEREFVKVRGNRAPEASRWALRGIYMLDEASIALRPHGC